MAPAAPAAVPWLFFRVRGLPCQFVAHLFFLEFCVTSTIRLYRGHSRAVGSKFGGLLFLQPHPYQSQLVFHATTDHVRRWRHPGPDVSVKDPIPKPCFKACLGNSSLLRPDGRAAKELGICGRQIWCCCLIFATSEDRANFAAYFLANFRLFFLKLFLRRLRKIGANSTSERICALCTRAARLKGCCVSAFLTKRVQGVCMKTLVVDETYTFPSSTQEDLVVHAQCPTYLRICENDALTRHNCAGPSTPSILVEGLSSSL